MLSETSRHLIRIAHVFQVLDFSAYFQIMSVLWQKRWVSQYSQWVNTELGFLAYTMSFAFAYSVLLAQSVSLLHLK